MKLGLTVNFLPDKYARRTTHSSRREDRERDRDRDHDGPREKVRSSVNVVSSSRKGSSEKVFLDYRSAESTAHFTLFMISSLC